MKKIFSPFQLDLRSLGLFRILLGFLFLLDIINKTIWAPEFYSDWGMFPRSVWIADFMSKYKFSFHLMSGDQPGVLLPLTLLINPAQLT